MLKDLKITEFLKKLSSADPVPGGGSAAALNAALAAGLTEMVANLTIGRKAFQAVENEMKEIAGNAADLRNKLLNDIDNDARAYQEVLEAFKLPKTTDTQKEKRSRRIQAAFKKAAGVPLSVARDALDTMALTSKVVRKGNKNAATDGAVGVLTARAAVMGALYNVKTNLNFIDDHKFVKETIRQIETIERKAAKKEKEVLSHVDI